MEWFLYFVSFAWVAAGAGLILYTGELRGAIASHVVESRRKAFAVAALVFGVLLVAAAGRCRYSWFVVVLGLAAVGKAVALWIDPSGIFEKVRGWYLETASDQTLRFMGIVLLILGTALFSWVQ